MSARSGVDMSTTAVSERLKTMSRMSDLRTDNRLDTKVDMSPQGITRRLRLQSRLRRLCLTLGKPSEPQRD